MDPHSNPLLEDTDPLASSRKKDHITLAFEARVAGKEIDQRFYYEPMLAAHPGEDCSLELEFLGKKLSVPVWVSSMTGGTGIARVINENLARACKDFGMGMGLGSCRSLLSSDEYLEDFDVRQFIGDDLPLYANLGIAQIERLIAEKKIDLIKSLIDKLRADGLIVHVNPMQEWLQPEGDVISRAPIDTITELLNNFQQPVIVKEVGQGFGPASLKALMDLPLAAIDLAANGGTNFSKLELLRAGDLHKESYGPLMNIGHSAEEMLGWINQMEQKNNKQIIISGGIKDFLDGYYLISSCKYSAIYGQASGFLKHARGDYQDLFDYVNLQVEGLKLAKTFLKVRT
jgi:isopentenyl-diphosphate delta-isomerase